MRHDTDTSSSELCFGEAPFFPDLHGSINVTFSNFGIGELISVLEVGFSVVWNELFHAIYIQVYISSRDVSVGDSVYKTR